MSIHRTDCVNILSLPEIERVRLLDADWERPEEISQETYTAEIVVYANDRSGLLGDISRVFTEKNISIMALNTRTNKQGRATLQIPFEIGSREALHKIVEKINGIDSVIDIKRTTG